jgi:CBS domain-containing protein/effector-binding domain-containing protein
MGVRVAECESERWHSPHVSNRQYPARTLSVRVRAPAAEVVASVEAVIERIVRRLREQHSLPLGPAFLAFHEFAGDFIDLEVGIPVEDAVQGDDEVQVRALPMGRYLSVWHQGTEPMLGDLEHLLDGWLGEHRERAHGPLYVIVVGREGPADGEAGSSVLVQRRITGGESCRTPIPGPRLAASEHALACAAAAVGRLAQNLPAPGSAESSRPAQPAPARLWQAFLERSQTMHVENAMTTDVQTCGRAQSLQDAARLLWDHDIGALPVVDDERRPIGMITDRDICMAAYTQGKKLSELGVASAMSQHIYVCHAQDLLSAAEQTMAAQQVRRLPVVNDRGTLIGMLSMNDIVLARTRTPLRSAAERLLGDITQTLAAISQHRRGSQSIPARSKRTAKESAVLNQGEGP